MADFVAFGRLANRRFSAWFQHTVASGVVTQRTLSLEGLTPDGSQPLLRPMQWGTVQPGNVGVPAHLTTDAGAPDGVALQEGFHIFRGWRAASGAWSIPTNAVAANNQLVPWACIGPLSNGTIATSGTTFLSHNGPWFPFYVMPDEGFSDISIGGEVGTNAGTLLMGHQFDLTHFWRAAVGGSPRRADPFTPPGSPPTLAIEIAGRGTIPLGSTAPGVQALPGIFVPGEIVTWRMGLTIGNQATAQLWTTWSAWQSTQIVSLAPGSGATPEQPATISTEILEPNNQTVPAGLPIPFRFTPTPAVGSVVIREWQPGGVMTVWHAGHQGAASPGNPWGSVMFDTITGVLESNLMPVSILEDSPNGIASLTWNWSSQAWNTTFSTFISFVDANGVIIQRAITTPAAGFPVVGGVPVLIGAPGTTGGTVTAPAGTAFFSVAIENYASIAQPRPTGATNPAWFQSVRIVQHPELNGQPMVVQAAGGAATATPGYGGTVIASGSLWGGQLMGTVPGPGLWEWDVEDADGNQISLNFGVFTATDQIPNTAVIYRVAPSSSTDNPLEWLTLWTSGRPGATVDAAWVDNGIYATSGMMFLPTSPVEIAYTSASSGYQQTVTGSDAGLVMWFDSAWQPIGAPVAFGSGTALPITVSGVTVGPTGSAATVQAPLGAEYWRVALRGIMGNANPAAGIQLIGLNVASGITGPTIDGKGALQQTWSPCDLDTAFDGCITAPSFFYTLALCPPSPLDTQTTVYVNQQAQTYKFGSESSVMMGQVQPQDEQVTLDFRVLDLSTGVNLAPLNTITLNVCIELSDFAPTATYDATNDLVCLQMPAAASTATIGQWFRSVDGGFSEPLPNIQSEGGCVPRAGLDETYTWVGGGTYAQVQIRFVPFNVADDCEANRIMVLSMTSRDGTEHFPLPGNVQIRRTHNEGNLTYFSNAREIVARSGRLTRRLSADWVSLLPETELSHNLVGEWFISAPNGMQVPILVTQVTESLAAPTGFRLQLDAIELPHD